MKNIARHTKQLVDEFIRLFNGLTEHSVIRVLQGLASLLQKFVNIYRDAPQDAQKGLRTQVNALLDKLKVQNNCGKSSKDICNFVSISTFLQHTFLKKGRRGFSTYNRAGKKRTIGNSISTLATYVYQLVPAQRFASERNKLFTELEIDDLRLFAQSYPYSIATLIRLIRYLQSGNIVMQPLDFNDPSLKRGQTRTMVSIPPADFLENLPLLARNEKVGILLGLASLRDAENAFLKTPNVFLDSPIPGLQIFGKGEKERFVLLEVFPLLLETLRQEVDRNELHVISKSSGQGYTPDGIATVIKKATENLKAPSINPHFLRHICVTLLLLLGVPLRDVKAIVGHAHEKTTIQEYHYGQAYHAYRILSQSTLYERLFKILPQAISIKEAAQVLRVCDRDMQYLCKQGKIRASKNKGQWYIYESDLLAYCLRRNEICCL